MPAEYAVIASSYILYDGTNSAEVLDFVTSKWSTGPAIVSEEDGVLSINPGDPDSPLIVVSAGQRTSGGYDAQPIDAADWAAQYIVKE